MTEKIDYSRRLYETVHSQLANWQKDNTPDTPLFKVEYGEYIYDRGICLLCAHDRKYMQCTVCRNFFARYATICEINDKRELRSVLWSIPQEIDLGPYREFVDSVKSRIEDSRVIGQFFSQQKDYLVEKSDRLHLGFLSTVDQTKGVSVAKLIARARTKRNDLEYLVNQPGLDEADKILGWDDNDPQGQLDQYMKCVQKLKAVTSELRADPNPNSQRTNNVLWRNSVNFSRSEMILLFGLCFAVGSTLTRIKNQCRTMRICTLTTDTQK